MVINNTNTTMDTVCLSYQCLYFLVSVILNQLSCCCYVSCDIILITEYVILILIIIIVIVIIISVILVVVVLLGFYFLIPVHNILLLLLLLIMSFNKWFVILFCWLLWLAGVRDGIWWGKSLDLKTMSLELQSTSWRIKFYLWL